MVLTSPCTTALPEFTLRQGGSERPAVTQFSADITWESFLAADIKEPLQGPRRAPKMPTIWILLSRGKSTSSYFANFNFIQLLMVFFGSRNVYQNYSQNIWSNPLFSFLISSTYHCKKVRKLFTKQGKKYGGNFHNTSFGQF